MGNVKRLATAIAGDLEALTWAIANGQSVKKCSFSGSLNQIACSAISLCKQGLRHLASCAQTGRNPEPLKIMGW